MMTIFIVDDKDTNLLLAKNALEGLYKTFALPSAERMFKLAERITPDLILLDVDMPDMDGFEAIQILKNDERFKSIPVIFLTGKNDTKSEIRGFELGALDFINKPFSAPILLRRIETHIEMDRQNKAIQHKNEELIKIHESKDNILAMISHDMKNYIGNIQGAIEVINTKFNAFDDNKFIKIIENSATKALSLVKDILTINKLEAEADTIEMVPHDINKHIAESIENLRAMAKQKNININVILPEEPIYCLLNAEKFHNALDNLCINAIKFTQSEGVITVKAEVIDSLAHIHVIDTGIGIDKEMIGRLFEKYTKAGRKGTAGEASTGLGLYIVKQIIGLHNGAIEVLSEVGKGSEFIMKLPVVAKE